jgi:transposase
MTNSTLIANRAPRKHIVAFEVSKQTLVVKAHDLDDRPVDIPNAHKPVMSLLKHELKRNMRSDLGPMLVICEATGGYERHVLNVCAELNIDVHRGSGSKIRHFAKSGDDPAKTDHIDVRVIGDYAAQKPNLRLYSPPPAEVAELRALQNRRSDLNAMLNSETNRLEHVHGGYGLKSLKAHIAFLKDELAALEKHIVKHVKSSATLSAKTKLMRTVSGVGEITANVLLAFIPDIGTLEKGQIARFAGLAPINKDSGKTRGPRHVEPGRHAIKRCLYMAVLAALRDDGPFRAYFQSLRARGKPSMLIIVALMRKLVVILNAVLKSDEPWRGLKTA